MFSLDHPPPPRVLRVPAISRFTVDHACAIFFRSPWQKGLKKAYWGKRGGGGSVQYLKYIILEIFSSFVNILFRTVTATSNCWICILCVFPYFVYMSWSCRIVCYTNHVLQSIHDNERYQRCHGVPTSHIFPFSFKCAEMVWQNKDILERGFPFLRIK